MDWILKATLQADYLIPYDDFWIVECGARNPLGENVLPVIYEDHVKLQFDPSPTVTWTGTIEVEILASSMTHYWTRFPEAFLFHKPERVWVPKSKFLALPVEKSLQVA